MQKITPFLWYDGRAEEAMNFYTSIFKNSKKGAVNPMSASFELEGQPFIAFNGGPMYSFNPSISLFVNCETQEEVDELWSKLSEGGSGGRCGWLTDKFGLSWQIIPSILGGLMSNPNVVQAMMQMGKIDIKKLQEAAAK